MYHYLVNPYRRLSLDHDAVELPVESREKEERVREEEGMKENLS